MQVDGVVINLPKELGKLIYWQDIDIKKEFISTFVFRLFSIVFSIFGCAICISLMIVGIKQNDIFLLISSLFFAWFFILLYITVANFLLVEVLFVFDKGVARYFFGLSKSVKKTEILNFIDSYKCEYEEGYEDPCSVVSKRFRIKAKWLVNSGKIFSIYYTPSDLKNKQALNEAILAYKTFDAKRQRSEC